MAERSKALVSGTSIFGCVGSNPTLCNFFLYLLCCSERKITNLHVVIMNGTVAAEHEVVGGELHYLQNINKANELVFVWVEDGRREDALFFEQGQHLPQRSGGLHIVQGHLPGNEFTHFCVPQRVHDVKCLRAVRVYWRG